jgi:hypothetical protein
MQILGSERVPAGRLPMRMKRLGAQYYPGRSNRHRHIYYSRSRRRWLAVSNEGGGWVRINQYAECPCGATK